MKRWMQKRSKVNVKQMASALGIREATAYVLANRGIGTMQGAMQFMMGSESDFHNPLLMKDMDKGTEIIRAAIVQNKKIVVYGDYDVDGVTSTTILYKAILALGGNVSYYLPHRQLEGYGLNIEAVEKIRTLGAEVILTCDNGIAAIEEIAYAKNMGMQVVVLDHHEPSFQLDEASGKNIELLPDADALIDPKQNSCPYPFKHLCAGGIAFQFTRALYQLFDKAEAEELQEFLTLAAIATVCDIVDLKEENRLLVKNGLKNIKNCNNMGLQALLEATSLSDKTITEYHFGFVIGPCINAAGRLESGEQAVALFCEHDEYKAMQSALELTKLNQERKEKTLQAVNQISLELSGQSNLDSVLVVYSPDIHESIAGIVAGRIKEQFYRPVIVLTDGEDMVKGSARSIEGYNIFEELQKCKDLFSRFGGHAMAAGLSLPYENITHLRQRLNESCPLKPDDMVAILKIEAALSFSDIDIALAKEIGSLAPFGKGNHVPLFGTKGVKVGAISVIGKNQDILRFSLHDPQSSVTMKAISFQGYHEFVNAIKQLYAVECCDKLFIENLKNITLDIVYQIDVNSYQGRESVQLLIQDFRFPQ